MTEIVETAAAEKPRVNLLDFDAEAVKAWCAEIGEKPFRATQLTRWIHRYCCDDFDDMTNLAKVFRAKLKDLAYIKAPAVVAEHKSADGTRKWLFDVGNGNAVEAVFIPEDDRGTLCISTQAGCAMGCLFCSTGKQGFNRNLTTAEIVGQLWTAEKTLRAEAGITDPNDRIISNVVLMGMGEPLDNYQNVLRFLELVSSDEGMNIGMRHISLSTCGIVDKIYDLAERKLQLTLSVSLHAPNDAIRSQTMPVNNRWGVDELLTACRAYAETTGRRISFEYAMISGVNDTAACAKELAARLHGMLCHVNLIPVNEVKGNSYRKSSNEQIQRFIRILSEKGITATVRRTLGSDINASCGQLRRRYQEEVANVADLYEN